jgi:hypothetical protein
MQPHIDVITLAVSDLERTLAFYRKLGFESPGIIGTEFKGDETHPGGAAAMFQLRGGLVLSLYAREDLAKDAGIPVEAPQSGEFSIGQIVSTKAEVDAVLREAAAAGGSVLGDAHDRPWGIYSGYFKDPDGHLWEVIWNPQSRAAEG